MNDRDPQPGDADGDVTPDEIDDRAAQVAADATPEADDPQPGPSTGTTPAEEQARRELRDPLKLFDALVRTASGAPVPEDMNLNMEDPEDRADMAARMLAPAYQRFAGAGALDWRVKAIGGLAVIVLPALVEGQLLGGGSDGDEGDEAEPATLPDGVRRPGEDADDEDDGPASAQEGERLSVGAQAGGE